MGGFIPNQSMAQDWIRPCMEGDSHPGSARASHPKVVYHTTDKGIKYIGGIRDTVHRPYRYRVQRSLLSFIVDRIKVVAYSIVVPHNKHSEPQ